MKVLADLSERFGFSWKLNEARQNLDRLEALASSLYAKYGLPIEKGAYWRDGGSNFRRVVAPRLKSSVPDVVDSHPLMPPMRREPLTGMGIAKWEDLGSVKFGPNHEASFAGTLLTRIDSARRLLDQIETEQNELALSAFAQGQSLRDAYSMWREEWQLGDLIEPTLSQIEGRKRGGEEKARRQNKAAIWAQWQACADTIFRSRPNLSKTAVAGLVKAKLRISLTNRYIADRLRRPEP